MKKSKNILTNTMVAGAIMMQSTLGHAQSVAPASLSSEPTIRPFHVKAPAKKLGRSQTPHPRHQWPEPENVKDASQGVQYATMQALAKYWTTSYDWRNMEAKLNALPQFVTTIDGSRHSLHSRTLQT